MSIHPDIAAESSAASAALREIFSNVGLSNELMDFLPEIKAPPANRRTRRAILQCGLTAEKVSHYRAAQFARIMAPRFFGHNRAPFFSDAGTA